MNKKIRNIFNRFVISLLSSLGIISLTSCMYGIPEDLIPGEAVAMYGVPGNFYRIEGTVIGDINEDGTVEDSEVVQNIKVYIPGTVEDSEAYSDPSEIFYNQAVTDENGNFTLDFNDINMAKDFEVVFEDVDGKENGSFKKKTIKISFDESDYVDTSNFGNEKYKKSLGKINLSENNE